MTNIRQKDFIQSITDALQFISYYHPKDYVRSLAAAYEREKSPAAKDAMDVVGVNTLYYVVNRYWYGAQKITISAKKEADTWWSIDDQDYVFKYTR